MKQPDLKKSVAIKNIVNVYFKANNIQFKLYIKRNYGSLVPEYINTHYNEGNILTKLRCEKEFKDIFFWIEEKYIGEEENRIDIPCINFAERVK